ncbi:MAG: amidophosphoribosyltransferase [Thermoproteota archaeon]
MAGILGIYLFDERWSAYRFGLFGLLALQHRGQEGYGLELLGKSRKRIVEKGSIEDTTINSTVEGHVCIGATLPYQFERNNAQPIQLTEKVSVVLDGKIVSIEGYDWDNSISYEENLRKAFVKIEKEKSSVEALRDYFSRCEGGFSYIAVNEKMEMIAGRDAFGVKPLVLGKIGFEGGIVASESCAVDIIGERVPISPVEDIEPGEARIFTPLSTYTERISKESRRAYCSFEYVYLARPDSYINGIPIYKVRKNIGKKIAEEDSVDADVVVGVPETATPFAMAYSSIRGIPVEKGFELTGRRVRSAIKPNQFERLKGIQLKLNVISEVVRGKRVVLIDDSVVRGNTLANIIYLMKEKGAKEVHVRIGSPPIVSHCPFGVEVPPEDELIGRHLTEEKIARVVGADSFKYLSLDSLVEAIGLPERKLCLGCFSGTYPEVCKR